MFRRMTTRHDIPNALSHLRLLGGHRYFAVRCKILLFKQRLTISLINLVLPLYSKSHILIPYQHREIFHIIYFLYQCSSHLFCLHGICPHVWPNQCRNPVLPCLHLSLVEIHTKLPVCFFFFFDLWYTEDTSQCRIAIWRSISTSPWHVLLSNSALYSKLADHSLFDNAIRKIDVGLNYYTWLPCILQVPMIKRKKMWRKNAPHRP